MIFQVWKINNDRYLFLQLVWRLSNLTFPATQHDNNPRIEFCIDYCHSKINRQLYYLKTSHRAIYTHTCNYTLIVIIIFTGRYCYSDNDRNNDHHINGPPNYDSQYVEPLGRLWGYDGLLYSTSSILWVNLIEWSHINAISQDNNNWPLVNMQLLQYQSTYNRTGNSWQKESCSCLALLE